MVDLSKILELSLKHNVEFSIEVHNKRDLIYCFGKIKWIVPFGQDFDDIAMDCVERRLKAQTEKKEL